MTAQVDARKDRDRDHLPVALEEETSADQRVGRPLVNSVPGVLHAGASVRSRPPETVLCGNASGVALENAVEHGLVRRAGILGLVNDEGGTADLIRQLLTCRTGNTTSEPGCRIRDRSARSGTASRDRR